LDYELFATPNSEQKLFHQRGLADSRLAGDKYDLPFTGQGFGEQTIKLG
jgi:hypothetical protein